MTEEIRETIRAARPEGWLVEPQAREILNLLGVDAGGFAWAKTPEEAVEAAGKLGFPVAMKVVSFKIMHKSDSRGVALNLADAGAVRAAWTRMAALPGFIGAVVDRMRTGVELIVGSKDDPQFGPVVVIGIGGTAVEVYSDVVLLLAPATEEEVLSALERLKGKVLLEGFRGAKAADKAALARLVANFSQAAMELGGEVASIDLNPVFCSPEGCFVADARMVLEG